MRKAPELRFDGFEEEWEEGTLSDLGSVSMNKRIYKDETSEIGDVPFYKIGTFGSKADSYISRDLFEEYKSKYPYPKVGDLLISASGSIGKVIEYKGEDAYYQDSNIVWLDVNDKVKNSFLKQFYETVNWNELEGSTIKRLYNKDLLRKKIAYPKLSEQEKIGDLFKKIDDLIEIQEGKLSRMEDFKKSMLQKMFPKKDELVPEFRFDGFDGEWGSTKLSYISNRVTRRNLENQSKLPLTISSEFGLVNQLDYYNNRVASKDISNYYLIINGEFAYNKSTSLGAPYGAIKRLDNYENGALSTLYIVFEIVENNLDYMKYYFETSLWHKEIYKVSQEGARNHGLLNIATNDFFSMRIKLPSLEEQQKIGNFFKNLDTQIENEEKLLDSYKMMKKSLLQKMFV